MTSGVGELTAEDRAAAVGRKVLAGLERGRRRAIESQKVKGKAHRDLVLTLAAADAVARRPLRGRAGRIARKLDGRLSESQVRKILRALFSVRDLIRQKTPDSKHQHGRDT